MRVLVLITYIKKQQIAIYQTLQYNIMQYTLYVS
jgi:hypothetical protein